jgi:hypothetical protein
MLEAGNKGRLFITLIGALLSVGAGAFRLEGSPKPLCTIALETLATSGLTLTVPKVEFEIHAEAVKVFLGIDPDPTIPPVKTTQDSWRALIEEVLGEMNPSRASLAKSKPPENHILSWKHKEPALQQLSVRVFFTTTSQATSELSLGFAPPKPAFSNIRLARSGEIQIFLFADRIREHVDATKKDVEVKDYLFQFILRQELFANLMGKAGELLTVGGRDFIGDELDFRHAQLGYLPRDPDQSLSHWLLTRDGKIKAAELAARDFALETLGAKVTAPGANLTSPRTNEAYEILRTMETTQIQAQRGAYDNFRPPQDASSIHINFDEKNLDLLSAGELRRVQKIWRATSSQELATNLLLFVRRFLSHMPGSPFFPGLSAPTHSPSRIEVEFTSSHSPAFEDLLEQLQIPRPFSDPIFSRLDGQTLKIVIFLDRIWSDKSTLDLAATESILLRFELATITALTYDFWKNVTFSDEVFRRWSREGNEAASGPSELTPDLKRVLIHHRFVAVLRTYLEWRMTHHASFQGDSFFLANRGDESPLLSIQEGRSPEVVARAMGTRREVDLSREIQNFLPVTALMSAAPERPYRFLNLSLPRSRDGIYRRFATGGYDIGPRWNYE